MFIELDMSQRFLAQNWIVFFFQSCKDLGLSLSDSEWSQLRQQLLLSSAAVVSPGEQLSTAGSAPDSDQLIVRNGDFFSAAEVLVKNRRRVNSHIIHQVWPFCFFSVVLWLKNQWPKGSFYLTYFPTNDPKFWACSEAEDASPALTSTNVSILGSVRPNWAGHELWTLWTGQKSGSAQSGLLAWAHEPDTLIFSNHSQRKIDNPHGVCLSHGK